MSSHWLSLSRLLEFVVEKIMYAIIDYSVDNRYLKKAARILISLWKVNQLKEVV